MGDAAKILNERHILRAGKLRSRFGLRPMEQWVFRHLITESGSFLVLPWDSMHGRLCFILSVNVQKQDCLPTSAM